MPQDRPDASSSDDELQTLLLHEVSCFPDVEVHLTPEQLREAINVLARDGQEALGIDDPIAAGWALFIIHLEELAETLRPDEHHIVWHDGALHRSVRADGPPTRGALPDPPQGGPEFQWTAARR
ncbi:hypothetical protein [Ornithinimicrobium cryptoxanthini]|uniref:hypothetical protein n=1 Tax=Ornithinimicrobium cryptoxanthini TaxID=2934161 RepID=UPI002118B04A|nr:hypothetical protein [Ornithinimicrobium cryptoxanthini]